MVLGRMVYNFTASAKILDIKAWRFGLYFVLLNIVAFAVQAVGAAIASRNDAPQSRIMKGNIAVQKRYLYRPFIDFPLGLHVYMGGVGLQQLFILCFIGLTIRFQRQIKRDAPVSDQKRALRLLYILYAVLTLITVSFTPPPPRYLHK